MARLFTSGAESNDASLENIALAAGVTISSANPRTGTYAYRATSASLTFNFTGAVGTICYARAYVYLTGAPSAMQLLLALGDGGINRIGIAFNTDGTLLLRTAGGTNIGSPSDVLSTPSWHCIELAYKVGTGATDYAEGKVNGVSFASSSTVSLTDNAPGGLFFAYGGGGLTVDTDDVALNDDTGASQNTWPGEGRIVLLIPTADSAVGTGWTLGTGTAISGNSGSTAVKNRPPLGVADLAAGSDTKQIRNASSNANVNYDATMTTYAAAGVTPADIVNLVVPIIATAAPVTTSSKQGTVGVVSNPTIANVALGAVGTPGAFWAGSAGGTYVTGWKITRATLTYNPSVVVTTAPVMRITQVTANTRIAVVCFMGMFVDFTQGRNPQVKVIKQAINRAAVI